MIDFTLANPSPVPCCFVVNNGSNIFSMFSFGMPSPESSNSMIRLFFSLFARMIMLPPFLPIASTEFDNRFPNAASN